MTISLEQAQTVVAAALAHGTEQGFNPLTVAVLDPGGAIVALARARRGVVLLAAAATVGFAVPWGVFAASTDDSGLWAVGLVLLLAGAFVGLVVVLTVAQRVMRLSSR